jgi:hypothetical protein
MNAGQTLFEDRKPPVTACVVSQALLSQHHGDAKNNWRLDGPLKGGARRFRDSLRHDTYCRAPQHFLNCFPLPQ